MIEFNKYLRRSEAATYLRERYGYGAPATLAKLACVGGGPIFRKSGRIPLYLHEDLDTWAQARLSEPVASTAALAA